MTIEVKDGAYSAPLRRWRKRRVLNALPQLIDAAVRMLLRRHIATSMCAPTGWEQAWNLAELLCKQRLGTDLHRIIPHYFLHEELKSDIEPTFLHIEPIRTRSSRHGWTIRAHTHPATIRF